MCVICLSQCVCVFVVVDKPLCSCTAIGKCVDAVLNLGSFYDFCFRSVIVDVSPLWFEFTAYSTAHHPLTSERDKLDGVSTFSK